MDPALASLLVAVIGAGGLSSVLNGLLTIWREKRTSNAPLTETAARIDIAKQLDSERTTRVVVERERDEANERAARAGRERDAADRRAEAADRRANSTQREADGWERYASELREDCLAHGTPLTSLRPRPAF